MISANIWSSYQGQNLKIKDSRTNKVYIIWFNFIRKEWEYLENGSRYGVNEIYNNWELLAIIKPIKTILNLP